MQPGLKTKICGANASGNPPWSDCWVGNSSEGLESDGERTVNQMLKIV
jgi:hypothetical protein